MAELLSRLDLFAIGRRYILAHAKRIEPTQVDVDGSDVNLFVGSMSFVANAIERQLGERLNALLIDGAEDEDLDRVVIDRIGEARKGAAAALVFLDFERPTSAGGLGNIAAGTKVRSLTGIEYVLLQDASFGLLTTKVADVLARAVNAGKEFQVGANTIRRWANQGAIFDQTIAVNNPAPASGGEPRESDDDYRTRAKNFWTASRRGTLGAIEYGALATPGVSSASAFEITEPVTGYPGRLVELFIADSSGVASRALATSVDQTLMDWRAGGIFVRINTCVPQIVDVTLSLQFNANVNTVTLTNNVRNAIVSFINSLGVNSTLYRGELMAVLSRFRSSGLIPHEGSIVSPVGDLVPSQGMTLRTRLENVTMA